MGLLYSQLTQKIGWPSQSVPKSLGSIRLQILHNYYQRFYAITPDFIVNFITVLKCKERGLCLIEFQNK